MARKPAKAPAAEGGPGHNSGDKEQGTFTQNLAKYERLLAAKKAADKALKDHGKIVKNDHGKNGLDMMKLTIAMRDPETAAEERQRLDDFLKTLRWAGEPIGFQGSLFDEQDGRTLEERAYEHGKREGMEGKPMSAPVEFGAGDPFQEWCKGWHAGQAAIFDIQKGPKPEDDAGGDGEGGGEDDEDDSPIEGEDKPDGGGPDLKVVN